MTEVEYLTALRRLSAGQVDRIEADRDAARGQYIAHQGHENPSGQSAH